MPASRSAARGPGAIGGVDRAMPYGADSVESAALGATEGGAVGGGGGVAVGGGGGVGVGFWAATWPAGTTGSNASVLVPTVSPALTIAWSADDSSLPFRSGTGTVPRPVATVILTVLPWSTFVPGSGSWARTWPSG